MDPRHLPPLRSGLGLPSTGQILTLPENTQQTLVATLAVLTCKAADLALKLAIHDSRSQATQHDVHKALKYQARHFIHTVDRPDVAEEIAASRRAIFGDCTDVTDDCNDEDYDTDDADVTDDDLEDHADEDHADEASPGEEQAVALWQPVEDEAYEATKHVVDGVCCCQECVDTRHAHDSWDDWQPDDPVEAYLRFSVDRAIQEASRLMEEDDF